MAIIGKIRDNSVLVVGVIGLGLFAFLFMDMKSCGGAPQQNMEIGSYNKKSPSLLSSKREKINNQEYQNAMVLFRKNAEQQINQQFSEEISKMEAQAGRELNSEELIELKKKYQQQLDNQLKNVNNQAWGFVVDSTVMGQEYDALSLVVDNKKELMSYLQGTNGFPLLSDISQGFTDSLGQIDTNSLRSRIKQLSKAKKKEEKEYWNEVKNSFSKRRLREKYLQLVKQGIYVTSLEAEKEYLSKNEKKNISYVTKSYSDFKPDEIKVSESEIKAYFEKHKEDAKYQHKENTRSLSFFRVPVLPSSSDSAKITSSLNKIKPVFASGENDSSVVVNNSSSKFYFSKTIALREGNPKSQELQQSRFPFINYPFTMDSIFNNADSGTVIGPFISNGQMLLAKISDRTPSSTNARHILIKTEGIVDSLQLVKKKNTTDSLLSIINKDNFEDLAKKYSDDPGSKEKGGLMEDFLSPLMVAEFAEYCDNAPIGKIDTVKTQYGYHIIEVLKRSDVKTPLVSYISKNVAPSDLTKSNIKESAYQLIEKYDGKISPIKDAYKKRLKFDTLTIKDKYSIEILEINENRPEEGGLQNLSDYVKDQIIKFAFQKNIKPGSIIGAPIDNKSGYIVAFLSSINEKESPKLEDLYVKIQGDLLMQKKFDVTAKKIASVKSLKSMAKILNTEVKNADITFGNNQIGNGTSDPIAVGNVFSSLKDGQQTKPIKGSNGIYVFKIEKTENAPAVKDYKKEKEQLLNSKRNSAENSAIAALIKKADVIDNRAFNRLGIIREDKSSNLWIWIVLGSIVLIGGGGFFIYKKRQDGQKEKSLRVGNE